jgi:hypothetical protein
MLKMEEVMTRKQAVVGVAIVMLLAANQVRAEECGIVNGSFEDDGWINDITVKEPNGWDVNVPADKFGGYVKQDWPTDGAFNLTLYSQQWKTFDVNDMTTVSQQVNLTGIDEVIFDVNLVTYPEIRLWDPDKCTAVVLIDGSVVWESNSVGTDVRGEYFDQAYTVEGKYKDGQHLLSFGIRVNVAEKLNTSYITHWDYIECVVYCGGGGLLPGDFNRDCYVDFNDLKEMTDVWLGEVGPNDKHNLFNGDDLGGGFINLPDFAIFADRWDGNISRLEIFADKWLQLVPNDDPDNLFKSDDKEPKGLINFFDFAIFADTWLGSSYIESP